MAFRVQIGSYSVECDTASDVLALTGGKIARAIHVGNGVAAEPASKKRDGRKARKGKANPAVKKMWAAAKSLAKKDGITVGEARKKLAKAK